MSQKIRLARIRGFTLVEVLVVISIVALLIAILLPSLSRARRQVGGVVCQSNMRQLMNGMNFYVADYGAFPGTHSLFWMQSLFGEAWPRVSGVTWDGARDRINGVKITPPYTQPYDLDPEFIADVPGKGTVFPYIKDESVYVCPSDRPGESQETPGGGGGNGRLSYGLNAYVGYRSPESLARFRYVADSLDNPLPGGEETRSFVAGELVRFAPARFKLLFEEHPQFHMNAAFPDGNFNGLDRIATRHAYSPATQDDTAKGRTSMGYLDGHAESPLYAANTMGRELFAEMGQPHFWRHNRPTDIANMSAFVKRLRQPCPW